MKEPEGISEKGESMTTSTPSGKLTPFLAAKRREEFKEALAAVNKAQAALRDLELPDFWEHPTCCDNQTLQVVEPGYWRWETIDEVEPSKRIIHAYTDGWDSMSETGCGEYLECNPYNGGCGAIWAVPDELDWD